MKLFDLSFAWLFLCVAAQVEAASPDVSGDWLCADDIFEYRLSLGEDGRYSNEPSMMGQVVLEEQGSWTFKDEVLVLSQEREIKRGLTAEHRHVLTLKVTDRTADTFVTTNKNALGSDATRQCKRA